MHLCHANLSIPKCKVSGANPLTFISPSLPSHLHCSLGITMSHLYEDYRLLYVTLTSSGLASIIGTNSTSKAAKWECHLPQTPAGFKYYLSRSMNSSNPLPDHSQPWGSQRNYCLKSHKLPNSIKAVEKHSLRNSTDFGFENTRASSHLSNETSKFPFSFQALENFCRPLKHWTTSRPSSYLHTITLGDNHYAFIAHPTNSTTCTPIFNIKQQPNMPLGKLVW